MSADEWESVLGVNLTGAFNCLQQAANLLRPGGRIVNLASVSGQLGLFGQANYAGQQGGIDGADESGGARVRQTQITVNAVAPSFIETEMTRGMPEAVTREFIAQIPLGRMGTIEDIVQQRLHQTVEIAH